MTVKVVGLDIAKHVFQAHGADRNGKAVLRKRLKRSQVSDFFASIPSCVVGIEATRGAHYWARVIRGFGQPSAPPAHAIAMARSSAAPLPNAISSGRMHAPRPGGRLARVLDTIDHQVALKRGGADEPGNMQWQSRAAVRAKDRLE